MKVITDLKNFVAKRKINLETPKYYLNSEFLNTANCIKIPLVNANITYMDYSENGGTPVIRNKTIVSNTLSLPVSQNILEQTLSNTLYNKYLTLAKNNIKGYKSFGKRIIPNKFLQKIRNYVYGENDIIINQFKNTFGAYAGYDETSYRRLVTKIIHCSNNIAVNSRFGPANFIVISRDLKWLRGFLTSPVSPVLENNNALPFHMFAENPNQIYKIGKLADIDVFVNKNEKKTMILIGRKNSSHEMGGVILAEHQIKIEDRISWTGFIENTSENSNYMFDVLNIALEYNLPWYKKLLNKYLKFKNING